MTTPTTPAECRPEDGAGDDKHAKFLCAIFYGHDDQWEWFAHGKDPERSRQPWRDMVAYLRGEFAPPLPDGGTEALRARVAMLEAALRHFAYPGVYTGQPTQEQMLAQARTALASAPAAVGEVTEAEVERAAEAMMDAEYSKGMWADAGRYGGVTARGIYRDRATVALKAARRGSGS